MSASEPSSGVSSAPCRSHADRKELQYYVNLVSQHLEMTSNHEGDDANTLFHTQDYRLQLAIDALKEGLAHYPEAYELKYLAHRVAIKEGAISDAVRLFNEMRRDFRDHGEFKEYLVNIAQSVRSCLPDENYNLFLKVDPHIRQEILLHSAMHLETKRAYTEACHLYFVAVSAWPQLCPQYGAHAACLAVDCEKKKGLGVFNSYREKLATIILPRILDHKLVVYQQDVPALNFNHHPYHFEASAGMIMVPSGQIELWLEHAQGYFIATRDWFSMVEISLNVMQRCDYINLGSWASIRAIAAHLLSEPYTIVSKLVALVEQNIIVENGNTFMASLFLGCFVHLCYEFYEWVAGLRDVSCKGLRVCLVPVKPIPTFAVSSVNSPRSTSLSPPVPSTPVLNSSTWTFPLNQMQQATWSSATYYSEAPHNGQLSKKRRVSFLIVGDNNNGLQGPSNNTQQMSKSRGIDVMLVKNILNDDQHDNGVTGISADFPRNKTSWESCSNSQKAIICLNQVRQCWQVCERLFQQSGISILENELQHLIQTWKLPTYIANALSIARGELALSSPSVNLQEVEYHYKSILQQFQGCKEKKCSRPEPLSSASLSNLVLETAIERYNAEEVLYVEPKTPMMIPFRVLYTSAMLYAMIGWWKEARSDLLIILLAMPFGTISKEHFEQDDELLNNIQPQPDNDSRPECSYQVIEVSQEGLAVRTIKALINTYEQELCSTLSYRQDAALGDLVILSQYGWPYWRDRLFRLVLLPRIRDRGGLKCPKFLQFVHNVDILNDISDMYKDQPDSNFDLIDKPCDSSEPASQTQASMKAVAEHVTCVSLTSSKMNEVLIDFLKERCMTEPVDNHNSDRNKPDCEKNNEESNMHRA